MGETMSTSGPSNDRSCPAITLMAPPKSVFRQGTEWRLTMSSGLTAFAADTMDLTALTMRPHFQAVHSAPWAALIQRAASAVPVISGGRLIPVSFLNCSRQLRSKQLLAIDAGVLSG